MSNIVSGNTFIPHSISHFQLPAEIFPPMEQTLYKAAPCMETHFSAADAFWLTNTTGLIFQRHSFKVAEQIQYINVCAGFGWDSVHFLRSSSHGAML